MTVTLSGFGGFATKTPPSRAPGAPHRPGVLRLRFGRQKGRCAHVDRRAAAVTRALFFSPGAETFARWDRCLRLGLVIVPARGAAALCGAPLARGERRAARVCAGRGAHYGMASPRVDGPAATRAARAVVPLVHGADCKRFCVRRAASQRSAAGRMVMDSARHEKKIVVSTKLFM